MAQKTKDDLSFIQNEETRAYVERRLIDSSKWYARKSVQAKKVFYRCSIATLIFNGLITVLSVVADAHECVKFLITFLGASCAVINGYLALADTKNQWIRYRENRENLLSLLEQYRMRIGMFAHISSDAEKDALLVKSCERILTSEVNTWITKALEDDLDNE